MNTLSLKKKVLVYHKLTHKAARELLNQYEKVTNHKFRLPRQGHKMILSFPNNPNMIEIWHGKGMFTFEQYVWEN